MKEISTPLHTDRRTDKHTILPESREIIFHHHFLECIQFWTENYGSVFHAFFLLELCMSKYLRYIWTHCAQYKFLTASPSLLYWDVGLRGGVQGSVLTDHELDQSDTVVQACALELPEVQITFSSAAPQNHFTARPTSLLMLKCLQISAPWKSTQMNRVCSCATFKVLLAAMVKEQVLRDDIPWGFVTIYQSVLRNVSEDVDLHHSCTTTRSK